MRTFDFARKYLFGPLGITDVEWRTSPQGIDIGWGEMWLKPHDMAKIGWLYLCKGRWNSKQIIPSAWVEDSTRAHIKATEEIPFGAIVTDIPEGINLESYGPISYASWLKSIGGSNIKVISNKEITLKCRTKAYRTNITWLWKNGMPITTCILQLFCIHLYPNLYSYL